MKINNAFCLFEQSGTFKNELKALGIHAEDFDIQNEFGETDHVVDLFAEIDNAFDGKPSIFDKFGKDDLVFAFFPCTRFEAIIPLAFRGEQLQIANQTEEYKLQYSMKLHEELHGLYMRICKLFTICLRGGLEDDRGKSGNTAALSYAVFPGKTKGDRQGQNGKRGLLRKANAVLVSELRPGKQCGI